MQAIDFFNAPQLSTHKQYEALRAFYIDNKSADEIAKEFGYSKSTVYSLIRDFKSRVKEGNVGIYFFNESTSGRKPSEDHDEIRELVILLRKKYLSVPDIKAILDAQNKLISERHIFNILHAEGFARLPRRNRDEKQTINKIDNKIVAPKTCLLTSSREEFSSLYAGMLIMLPYIKYYGIDNLIEKSSYPGTKQIPKLNSILSFIGLKLSNMRRYTADDQWCMDRGAGLFSGLNVLPKAAWYTSYSSRILSSMNLSFLKEMYKVWKKHGLLSDTVNLDFVAVPYWGEEDHLENNWSGTRHKALCSVLAAVAQDPDTGIITYGDANVRHENESDITVEFLDFYHSSGGRGLKYMVFDSKFTTYENMRKIEDNNYKFITIRRRGKKIIDELESLPTKDWRRIRVPMSNGRTRQIKIHEQIVNIKEYGKGIRQIAITGHGKIKPAIIITNDFDVKVEDVVRKYARRWLVEKTISEQTHFFHLNRLSSSIVIKVDFDLTMTILSHNIYRLLAMDLPGFEHNTSQKLYDKFVHNEGTVVCDERNITVNLKKKRNLPIVLDALEKYLPIKLPWLDNRALKIHGATTT